MKTILSCLVLVLIAFGIRCPAAERSASDLLERGLFLEQTRGDLSGAIDAYERIIEQQRANRLFVARAYFRLGACHLRLGQKSKAVAAFKKVIDDYPDQAELAEDARRQMPLVFEETFEQIEENYFQDVDRGELMEAAIHAMLSKLDATSDYLDPVRLKEFRQVTERSLSGIGAALNFEAETKRLLIAKPLYGSPAADAGLLPGDRILEIDGRSVEGLDMREAVNLIRGPAGEPVTLGIQRGDRRSAVRIVRGPIRLDRVRGTHRNADGTWNFTFRPEDTTGYMRITDFAQGTADEARAAVEALSRQGIKALIVDLRANPGGLLAEALGVADLFVSEGVLLTSKGRQEEQSWSATREGTFGDLRLVLLVDGATASASEVVCVALQDHDRAAVAGQRTYGMGLIKSLLPLQGGESALRLPVATYFRPNGGNIHRHANATEQDVWGVLPDPGLAMSISEEERKRVIAVWEGLETSREVVASDINDALFQLAWKHLNQP